MLFHWNRTTLGCMAIFRILSSFFLMSVFFLGCNRIHQVIAPADLVPEGPATVKIGFMHHNTYKLYDVRCHASQISRK
jgi:hypothetical protein